MTRLYWALLACAVGLGCNDHNHYVVELTPRGQEVERRITLWRVDPRGQNADRSIPPEERNIVAFPEDELARIAALYPRRITPPGGRKHAFAGTYGGWVTMRSNCNPATGS